MIGVAACAVLLAALRSENYMASGIAIVASCVSYLAYKGATNPDRRAVPGPPRSRWWTARLILITTAKAAAVIGASDAAFLVGYSGYMGVVERAVRRSHFRPGLDLGCMTTAIALGALMALVCSAILGVALWPDLAAKAGPSRRWPLLTSGLLVFLFGSVQMQRFPAVWLEVWSVVLAGSVILGVEVWWLGKL